MQNSPSQMLSFPSPLLDSKTTIKRSEIHYMQIIWKGTPSPTPLRIRSHTPKRKISAANCSGIIILRSYQFWGRWRGTERGQEFAAPFTRGAISHRRPMCFLSALNGNGYFWRPKKFIVPVLCFFFASLIGFLFGWSDWERLGWILGIFVVFVKWCWRAFWDKNTGKGWGFSRI